jgi:hypothetical protein
MKSIQYFVAALFVCLSGLAVAGQSQQYEAGIVCADSTSLTDVKYLSANSDFEAQSQVRDMLYNNTGYRGRQCVIKYVKNTSAKTAPQKDRTYELGIVCEKSSSVTDVKYLSAPSDLEAENRAREILYNNTGYSNQRCAIKYLRPS